MKTVIYLVMIFLTLFCEIGNTAGPTGIGQLANDLYNPVSLLGDFIVGICAAAGIGCLFASFLRYKQYKKSPLGAPLSTVFVFFLLGLALLALPFFHNLTGNSLPFASHLIK